jgi:hypothetical protein
LWTVNRSPDGKALGTTVDDKAREHLMQQLKELCDATKHVYDDCERGDVQVSDKELYPDRSTLRITIYLIMI